MMPPVGTAADHGTPPASARRLPGQSGTRPTDPDRSACDLAKICMTTPKRGGMQPSPIDWLERDYDQPDTFTLPPFTGIHTPLGLFSAKPNHRPDCLCETGEGEIWLQADVAAKWRAS